MLSLTVKVHSHLQNTLTPTVRFVRIGRFFYIFVPFNF